MKRTVCIFLLILLSALVNWTGGAEEGPAKVAWRTAVSGVVFSDGNANRLYDRSDSPGKGLVVKLFSRDVEEIEIARLRTDEEGRFEFDAVLEGLYRLEVTDPLKKNATSYDFEVKAGKVAPFFAIQLNPPPSGYRGRVANPRNTEGKVISPFSPDSGRDLSGNKNKKNKGSES